MMTPRYLRILFLSEFLVAVIAIFTAWSEIGGQAVLDVMPWGWKGSLAFGLAAALVAYSVALMSADSVWNVRTAKWLALILVLVGAMGVVTFYYALQAPNEPPEEQDNSASGLRSGSTSPGPLIHPHRKFV
jgi:hypothetical protein